jgi:hypothetical protein
MHRLLINHIPDDKRLGGAAGDIPWASISDIAFQPFVMADNGACFGGICGGWGRPEGDTPGAGDSSP